MKYEFYKLFVKRKAWLLIPIFMLLRLITVFLQPNYVRDYKMEMYRDSYMQHMEVLEGKLSDEKSEYISEQNEYILELLRNDRNVIIGDYVSGAISEEEFNRRYSKHDAGSRMQTEFEVINERYQSVQRNPERIYFMYTNGWTGLIGNENLDFVLLLLLMLLFVPMVCDEFRTEMYPLLRTTPNGGVRLFASKFAVGMITSIVCAVLFFAEEFLYFKAVFGLPHGEFPLQSLAPFENSPYQLSIYGAVALTLANRCIGAVFMTAFLLCLSAVFRRSLSAFFLGTTCILIPFILFSESRMKYLFPTPLGFFLSSGFIKGTYPVSPYSSQIVTITPKQYLTTVLLSLSIALLMFIVGLFAFAGKKIRIRKAGVLVCVLSVISLTACGAKPSAPDFRGFVYDKRTYQPVAEGFAIALDENYRPCFYDTENDIYEPLIRDPFADTTAYGLAVMSYIDGETIYYLNQHTFYHYEIVALDTRDFSEKTVHEVEWSSNVEEMDMLFGLGFYLPKKMQEDETVDSFFVHDNQLFISKSKGIYWYDLNTDREIRIYDKKAENFAFTCGAVYYTDEFLDLYRYDVEDKNTEKLSIGKTDVIYATADGLYCKNLLEGAWYFVSPDGSDKKLLEDFNEEEFIKENMA